MHDLSIDAGRECGNAVAQFRLVPVIAVLTTDVRAARYGIVARARARRIQHHNTIASAARGTAAE